MRTLDLSYNPFSPANALLMLQKMREREVVLQTLNLDNVVVGKEFVAVSFSKRIKVIFGAWC